MRGLGRDGWGAVVSANDVGSERGSGMADSESNREIRFVVALTN